MDLHPSARIEFFRRESVHRAYVRGEATWDGQVAAFGKSPGLGYVASRYLARNFWTKKYRKFYRPVRDAVRDCR
jgi:hypothetical protein